MFVGTGTPRKPAERARGAPATAGRDVDQANCGSGRRLAFERSPLDARHRAFGRAAPPKPFRASGSQGDCKAGCVAAEAATRAADAMAAGGQVESQVGRAAASRRVHAALGGGVKGAELRSALQLRSAPGSLLSALPRRVLRGHGRPVSALTSRLPRERALADRDRGPLAPGLNMPRSSLRKHSPQPPANLEQRKQEEQTSLWRRHSEGAQHARSSSTSTARSRSTVASRSHGGLTARRRNHEPVGSAPPASRAAARAVPSRCEGGSRPGPRPRSARRRAVLR